MIRWPRQPSLTDPNRLPAVANELMAIMAAANAKVDAIQHQQPRSGRTKHGARSPQSSFLGSQSLSAGHAVQERPLQGTGHEESSRPAKPCIDPDLSITGLPGNDRLSRFPLGP